MFQFPQNQPKPHLIAASVNFQGLEGNRVLGGNVNTQKDK